MNLDYFFQLFKLYWIKCRELEDGINTLESFQKLKSIIVSRLYKEYVDFNLDKAEFYFAIGGIELKDELLNPLSFNDHPIGYVPHIKNCFLLSDRVFF